MASSLAVHAYDTLSIARGLERDYAFGKKQAEGIARTIHEHLVANVATKDDLEHLRIELTGKIAEVHSELTGKIAEVRLEIAEVRGEIVALNGRIDRLESRIDRLEGRIDNLGKALTFRMGAMIATGIGLLAALQAVIG